MRTLHLTLLIVLAAVAVSGARQDPAGQTPPQPRFETRADLVLVDVSVVDGDSRPIEGLGAADFELKVNGKPRAVQNVQFIATPGAAAAPERTPRDTHYTTNEGFSTGRLLLFAVDENHLRAGASRAVLNTAEKLLDTLAPGDLVGLARIPRGVGGVEFTTDRARLRRALGTVVGMQPSTRFDTLRVSEAWAYENRDQGMWSRVIDRECRNLTEFLLEACVAELETKARGVIAEAEQRSMESLRFLEDLLGRLAVMKTPITVVLISQGMFVARDHNPLTEFARRAAEARVTMHIVQPGDSMFDGDIPEAGGGGLREDMLLGEGLEMMAGHTRGAVYKISISSGANAFERIRRELSGYYLLAFEPTEADRSADREIDVNVRRRGARVRARSTFALPDPAAVASANAGPEEQVKDLLVAPLPASGLPMRVATYAISNQQDGKVRVIVSAEIGEPANDAAEWPVGLLLISRDEKFVVHAVQPMTIAPASPRSESPRLFLNSVVVEPGEYTVRIAARAPDGRIGSVHHAVDARLRSIAGDAVRMSDLIVSAPPARGEAPRPTPSAVIDSDALTAALELTGSDAKRLARSRVDFEIAESETGPALMSAEGKAEPRLGSPERVFTANMPLGLIPAGEYVVRAVIRVPDEDERRVARPFRAVPPVLSASEAAIARPEPADPDAAPVPPPPSRIIAPVPRFTPAAVLETDVVNTFLDVLQRQYPASAANAPIVAQARTGAFVVKPPDGKSADDLEPSLTFVRGLASLQKNEIAQAQAWFEMTLKSASDFLGAAFYLGAVHAASGRDTDAVGAWQMSLIGEGGDRAYPVLVDAHLRLGDAQAALDLIEEAPDAWPSVEARQRRVAIAQAMLGRYRPALDTVTALLETQSADRDLLFVALQVLYRQHTDTPLAGADKERFVDYAERYVGAKGSQAALVSSWLRQINR